MEPVFPFVFLGLAVGLMIWGVNNLSVEERYTKLFATSATGVGVGVLGWFFTTYGKDGSLYAVFSVLLLIGLLGWGLIDPVVGRRLARNFAVIAMGLGTGFLFWGISGAVSGERLRPPFGSNIITEVSEAIGWGAGFLTGGIVALVLSFLGKTKTSGQPDAPKSEPTLESPHHPV
jgi:sugar phosphate permease